MNEILKDLVNEGHVVVYLDDILIFSDSLEQHRKLVRRVLSVLREHKLFLKPEKCFFEQTEVNYLGLIVGNGELRMDPEKVTAVAEWPKPRNKKDVQSFLGFCNFYRRFIKDFSAIARPLTSLTGNVEWNWTSEQRTAFTTLRDALCAQPILSIPVDDAPFRL